MAKVALSKTEGDDAAFYQAKLATACFYFRRLLPRTKTHFDAAFSFHLEACNQIACCVTLCSQPVPKALKR